MQQQVEKQGLSLLLIDNAIDIAKRSEETWNFKSILATLDRQIEMKEEQIEHQLKIPLELNDELREEMDELRFEKQRLEASLEQTKSALEKAKEALKKERANRRKMETRLADIEKKLMDVLGRV
jgi:chromosome segregation ATPase